MAIRGGGHNVGGRALCDDGIVIDLSRMRSVYVDAANQRVRVQGGTTLGDLDRKTHVFGLAVVRKKTRRYAAPFASRIGDASRRARISSPLGIR
jgi:hypothetical protein